MSRPRCVGLACDVTQGLCDECLRYWLNRPAPKGNWRERAAELEATPKPEQQGAPFDEDLTRD